MLVALPTFSSGATVRNDLRSFQAVSPRAAAAPDLTTEPPLHGVNPHGQGTAAVVDLNPSSARPFSEDPTGATDSEDIVIGRSRGERRADGTYHGHVTVAALFGNELIPGADTGPNDAPVVKDILQPLLTALCTGGVSAGICLRGVHVESTTTTSGSTNNFQLLGATIGGVANLPLTAAVNISAARSDGNISNTATCQTTRGFSNVANAVLGAITASVSTSSSDTVACSGAGTSQTNDSSVIDLGTAGVPLPAAGCANHTADTSVVVPLIATIVCNGDDSSNTASTTLRQTDGQYGVRNALDVYVGTIGNAALLQLSTAQAESRSVAPAVVPVTTTPTPTTTTPTTTTTPAAAAPTATIPAVATPTPSVPTSTGDTGNAGDNGSGDTGNGGDTGGGGGGAAQCSDGVDNDGDGVIDAADPGCHSDGNANNPASYNPNDNSEANGGARLNGNELPFTGSDVVVLGLAGALLLAAGLALRGPARRRELDA